jgi:hypothetical protein
MEMCCRFCGHPIYRTRMANEEYGWNLVLQEQDDTFLCLARGDGLPYEAMLPHEPYAPIVRGTSLWLVKKFSGPEAERCIEEAITMAAVTGSVGATCSRGGDGPESMAEVVGLTERKPL